MKKAAIMVAAFILALFSAKIALGKLVKPADNYSTSNSGLIDVQIIERSITDEFNKKYITQSIDVSSIEEELNNLVPGQSVILRYTIVNKGCIDVLLSGVNIAVDNSPFADDLLLKWTLAQFEGAKQIKSVSNGVNGQVLKLSNGSKTLSFENIVLSGDRKSQSYCVMELVVTYIENSETNLSHTPQNTKFTITPTFIQH